MSARPQQLSYDSYDPVYSTKGETDIVRESFLTYARPRYWLCIVIHALVVLLRLAMALVWAFRVDHKLTFNIKHLSAYTAVLNFVATIIILGISGLTTWSIQGIAIHDAFKKLQTLTSLHDCISAWLRPGEAALTVKRNLSRRLPSTLLVILVYFVAAGGVSSTFVSSFTFGSFNDTISMPASVNSITTAPTKIPSPADLKITQIGAAFLRSSFDFFPSLNNVQLPGLGVGKIYNTLSNVTDPLAQVEVGALDFSVRCGEVPPTNYTIDIRSISGGFHIVVSAHMGGRTVGVSGNMGFGTRDLTLPAYKFLEEANPYIAPPSRNIYLLAVASSPDHFPRDSENSTGTIFSQMLGPVTIYTKVIICSLTVNDTTSIIDGLNRPVNRSDELPEPTTHSWAIQQPLPSRGLPYEDTFSALYGTPTGFAVKTFDAQGTIDNEMPFTLLEAEMLNRERLENSTQLPQTLQWLEGNLMWITSISYACLGEYFGYKNVDQEARQGGWDPQPAVVTLQKPVLRARLNMSKLFVLLGLAASIVLFISALLLLGRPPPIGERLVGDPGLLFVLSMVRHSTLPERMNQDISDLSALDVEELRRFGETVQVYFSNHHRQLDVEGCPLSMSSFDSSVEPLIGIPQMSPKYPR